MAAGIVRAIRNFAGFRFVATSRYQPSDFAIAGSCRTQSWSKVFIAHLFACPMIVRLAFNRVQQLTGAHRGTDRPPGAVLIDEKLGGAVAVESGYQGSIAPRWRSQSWLIATILCASSLSRPSMWPSAPRGLYPARRAASAPLAPEAYSWQNRSCLGE